MQVDFSSCLVFNTRMAARAVTRRFDAMLRPYGITSAQYALLGGMVDGVEATVTELADRNGLDRTSLTRNLDRLETRGLIASRPAVRGNGRLCAATPAGMALVEEIQPIWRDAQQEMRGLFAPDDFSTTLTALKRLSRV